MNLFFLVLVQPNRWPYLALFCLIFIVLIYLKNRKERIKNQIDIPTIKLEENEKLITAAQTVQKNNSGFFYLTSKRIISKNISSKVEIPLNQITKVELASKTVITICYKNDNNEIKEYIFLLESEVPKLYKIINNTLNIK